MALYGDRRQAPRARLEPIGEAALAKAQAALDSIAEAAVPDGTYGDVTVSGSTWTVTHATTADSASSVTAPGSDTQIVFNDGGALAGALALLYADTGTHLAITAQSAGDIPLDLDTSGSFPAQKMLRVKNAGAESFYVTQEGDVSAHDGTFHSLSATQPISLLFSYGGLRNRDAGGSQIFIIRNGETLTSTRYLDLIVNDANRALTVSGDATISGAHSGTNTGDQTITLTGDVTGTGTGSFAATIGARKVSYAKMQAVTATARVLGRISAGSGDVEELTGTQITTLLDSFTSLLNGAVPASGGGTTNFLRADGAWAAPSATVTPGGSSGQIQWNSSGTLAGTAAVTYAASGVHITITAQAATDIPLKVKGAASQSANLQSWRNSSDTEIAYVTAAGALNIKSYTQSDSSVGSTGYFSYGSFGLFTNGDTYRLSLLPADVNTNHRILSLKVNDANRTIDLSGNLTVSGASTLTGSNSGDQNMFSTISVSGQSDVVADSATDTLTLAAGSNISITTNATTDTITIAATGSASSDGPATRLFKFANLR